MTTQAQAKGRRENGLRRGKWTVEEEASARRAGLSALRLPPRRPRRRRDRPAPAPRTHPRGIHGGAATRPLDLLLSADDPWYPRGGRARRRRSTRYDRRYANRLIHEFKLGLLPLTDGTTLRTFLSKLLNCDPMRISKKFVGQNCIGKQVFRRRQQDMDRLSPEDIKRSRYLCRAGSLMHRAAAAAAT